MPSTYRTEHNHGANVRVSLPMALILLSSLGSQHFTISLAPGLSPEPKPVISVDAVA